MMLRSLSVLPVFVALAACATVPAATERPEAQVERASDEFSRARVRGDASSFAALFTDDGILMVPGLPDAAGSTAIRELAQKRLVPGRTTDFTIHRREIHVTGDSAHELAWYSETDRRQEQSFRMQARHSIVWKRGMDGVWRVQRYLYNFSDAAPIP